jgi:hypothetical protein
MHCTRISLILPRILTHVYEFDVVTGPSYTQDS